MSENRGLSPIVPENRGLFPIVKAVMIVGLPYKCGMAIRDNGNKLK